MYYDYAYWRQDNIRDRMNLEGQATIKVKPNIASVSLGIITENKELQMAQQENAEKTKNVIEAIVSQGIEDKDIKTNNYNIEPMYDYVEGKQVFRGYRVMNNMRVTIRNLDRVGNIIDTAVENGVNTVSSIEFTVANPALFYNQALILAVKDAIIKAEILERTLGVVVNRTPINITEVSSNYGIQSENTSMKLLAAASTPIKSGQIDITANIKAVFEYHSYKEL